MDKRSVIIGIPNNESWVEREIKRIDAMDNKPKLLLDEPDNWDGLPESPFPRLAMKRMATGGVMTGDCPDCKAEHSMVFSPGIGRCICINCNYTPTLIIINKTMAMGMSEQRINSIVGTVEIKGTSRK